MIIGLGHRARVGKDYAGRILEQEFGFVRLKFATPVYAMAAQLCGLPIPRTDDEMEAFKKSKVDLWLDSARPDHQVHLNTGRDLLQWFGTDIVRNAYADTWLAILAWEIRKLKAGNPAVKVVITDVRFPNEGDLVHAEGGEVIEIERPSLGPLGAKVHASETALLGWPGFDGRLVNDDTEAYPRLVRSFAEARGV